MSTWSWAEFLCCLIQTQSSFVATFTFPVPGDSASRAFSMTSVSRSDQETRISMTIWSSPANFLNRCRVISEVARRRDVAFAFQAFLVICRIQRLRPGRRCPWRSASGHGKPWRPHRQMRIRPHHFVAAGRLCGTRRRRSSKLHYGESDASQDGQEGYPSKDSSKFVCIRGSF
jgi:hypothetical protein